MKEYINDIGCSMSFDDDITDEQVNKRLKWLGSNWKLKSD